jgi:hypothetical protein
MAVQTHAPAQTRAPRTAERRFYTGMALAFILIVFVGFARSFFLRPLFPGWPSPAEPIFYVHGALFTGWCLLLIAQASLVASGRTRLHRRIGVYGAALAATMVAVGTYASLVAAARPTGFIGVAGIPPLAFLAVPLFDILLFGSFVTLAILRRRDLQSHKRWMLLATINLMTAAVARWPGVITSTNPLVFFGLTDLLLLPMIVWDVSSRGRLHTVTLWGGLIFIASQPLRIMVSGTDTWMAIAQWAVRGAN